MLASLIIIKDYRLIWRGNERQYGSVVPNTQREEKNIQKGREM